MKKKRKPIPKVSAPEFPVTFETFRRPGPWERGQLTSLEPSCFNGDVRIRRFRVTIEEIEEPREVLVERLFELWRECNNHHHWQPLKHVAASLGVEFIGYGDKSEIREIGKEAR